MGLFVIAFLCPGRLRCERFFYFIFKVSLANPQYIPQITLTMPWKKARKLIKEDPRYKNFGDSDEVSTQSKFFLLLWVLVALSVLVFLIEERS